MITLLVDTNDYFIKLALFQNDVCIDFVWRDVKARHAEELLPEVQLFLSKNNSDFIDVKRLMVCVGPGFFTSLRAGLAAVQGIAMGLSLPLYGVNAFEIYAAATSSKCGVILLDSRCVDLYVQRFSQGQVEGDPYLIKKEELLLQEGDVLLGNVACNDRLIEIKPASYFEAFYKLGLKRDPLRVITPFYVAEPKINLKKTSA